jgi:hypothetical protein
VTVALAVQLAESVTFKPDTDETVVPEGIPAPDTDCPAPILMLRAAIVTIGEPFAVVTESVKTPICDIVDPLISPTNTGVSTVLSIAARFCPGCANRS